MNACRMIETCQLHQNVEMGFVNTDEGTYPRRDVADYWFLLAGLLARTSVDYLPPGDAR